MKVVVRPESASDSPLLTQHVNSGNRMAPVRQKAATARTPRPKDAPAESVLDQNHIGQILRATREERGLTVEMVANELMIRRFYLEALENGTFHDLPERVYATGFVRSYANYMGMDSAQCVEQFKRDAYGNRGSAYRVELSMPEPVIHSVVPNRTAIVTAVIVLCALLGGVIYFANMRHDDALPSSVPAPVSEETAVAPAPELTDQAPEEAVASVPATGDAAVSFAGTPAVATASVPTVPAVANTTAAITASNAVPAALPAATAAAALPVTASPAPVATSAPVVKSEATPATAPVVAGFALEALQSSWVEIKDAKGAVLFTSILKQGQQLPLPDQKGLLLTTGNAGGLRLLRDGQSQQVLGAANEVKRNLSLDKLSKP